MNFKHMQYVGTSRVITHLVETDSKEVWATVYAAIPDKDVIDNGNIIRFFFHQLRSAMVETHDPIIRRLFDTLACHKAEDFDYVEIR